MPAELELVPSESNQVLPPGIDVTDRKRWLAERRKGLGGSDAAAALGLNPYLSPFALWLDKTGQIDGEVEETEAMLMGKLLEPIVVGRYQEAHPDVQITRSPGLFRHPEVHFMLGTPDALAGPDTIVEAKAVGYDFAKDWDDDRVPVRHRIQTYHYGAIMGRPHGAVIALIGGQRFVERELDLDPDMTDKLIERLDGWWTEHVVKGNPPEVDASESTTEALKAMYVAEPGEVAVLAPELVEDVRAYWKAHDAAKAAEEEKNLYANRLRQALGPVEVGTDDFGDPLVSWKASTTHYFDAAALKEDHPELHARYYRERQQRTLRPSTKLKG